MNGVVSLKLEGNSSSQRISMLDQVNCVLEDFLYTVKPVLTFFGVLRVQSL